MGNKNISVCERNGNARYPRWVTYQYQQNPTAYNVFAMISGMYPSPNVIGIVKNCATSMSFCSNVTNNKARLG